MSSDNQVSESKPRERRARRAEMQLYRPGALRQQREAAAASTKDCVSKAPNAKILCATNAVSKKQEEPKLDPPKPEKQSVPPKKLPSLEKPNETLPNNHVISSSKSDNSYNIKEQNNNPFPNSNKGNLVENSNNLNNISKKEGCLGKSYSRNRASKLASPKEDSAIVPRAQKEEDFAKASRTQKEEVSELGRDFNSQKLNSFQNKRNDDNSKNINMKKVHGQNSSVFYNSNKYEKSGHGSAVRVRENMHGPKGKVRDKNVTEYTMQDLDKGMESLSVESSSRGKAKSPEKTGVSPKAEFNRSSLSKPEPSREDAALINKRANHGLRRKPNQALTSTQESSRSRVSFSSEEGTNDKPEISKSRKSVKQIRSSPNNDDDWPREPKIEKFRASTKEFVKVEPSSSRGIIHVPSTSSALVQERVEPATTTKTLFNPNNPSKPTVVPSIHRGTHSSDSLIPISSTKPDKSLPQTNTEKAVEETKVDPSVLYNIQKGEMDINYYVSSNQIHLEFDRIMVIRQHLKDCYKKLIQSDIYLCQEKNIEAALWKSLYYLMIEKLREYIISNVPKFRDPSLKILCMIVDDGHEYFQHLINVLQETYEFSLEVHIAEDLTSKSYTKNRVRIAISMCQRFLLSLGDLARYRDQFTPNPNFSLSRKWYVMAQDVLPRNGRPFNQLAIIATNLKRPLDVVYYYIRSLTAANPFLSARDSLVAIFEDFRKMYVSLDSEAKDDQRNQNGHNDSIKPDITNLRQEIWIRPDTGSTDKRTLSESEPEDQQNSKEKDLSNMAPELLMKRFLMCYLHCHGMLFSKVGLDNFHNVLRKMLETFQHLLKAVPSRLSSIHLLQIHAINIFAIGNTQLKDCPEFESGYRSAAQDLALLLSQEMFGCLCEVTMAFLPSNINHSVTENPPSPEPSPETMDEAVHDSSRLFLPQVATFIPAIKVWCDWLLYNSTVWNPPAVSHELTSGTSDAWTKVAELATVIKGFSEPDIPIYENPCSQKFLQVILPEDRYLRGYHPLLSSQTEVAYTTADSPMSRAEDWVRLSKITLCLCQFLCGVEPPVLRLLKTDQGQTLVPLVQTTSVEVISDSQIDGTDGDGLSDDGVSDLDTEDADEPSDDSLLGPNMAELIRRKRQLEKDLREQRKARATVEGPITAQIEVRPRNLIPDTNCFIKYLDIIKRIITDSEYHIMVPLAVMDELTKMSTDLAVEKYGDANHAMRVRENASASVDYLNTSLKQGTRNLKCITSQGSILTSSFFAYEVNDDEMTNDDRILSCCVHLCSGSNRTRPISEGVRRVYRDVVLLTDDRILRIKAYSRDVPVRTLLDFAKWAEIPIGNKIGP